MFCFVHQITTLSNLTIKSIPWQINNANRRETTSIQLNKYVIGKKLQVAAILQKFTTLLQREHTREKISKAELCEKPAVLACLEPLFEHWLDSLFNT